MKTKAVRLYGANDLRLEEFELPALGEDEILVQIISDSICMSSYKAAMQGKAHKRVPKDVANNPIIIGHEFCGEILEVGKKWQHRFHPGKKFAIQPAINYPDGPVGLLSAPGYSYQYIGGSATHVIIPNEVMELGCLLDYNGDAFFKGSLAEPMSCIVGAYHASYHTQPGKYDHVMGIKEGGATAILAGVGPMGLGAIDYVLHCDRRPKLLVVTDIDDVRLARAAALYSIETAQELGITLQYVNTKTLENPEEYLRSLTPNNGFDDVLVFAPVAPVIEQADHILGYDGCLNFFAGPTNPAFSATFNFYNVHYSATHLVGTSGGNTDDMVESLAMMSANHINPATMITHIGGLNAAIPTTLTLPSIPGGKKLIYTNIEMDLTAIDDFAEKGKTDPLFAELAQLTARALGLWSAEAEKYLLANAKHI